MNLWHALPPGPDPPGVIYVIVEIPKGSRNKYEYHKTAGIIKLDRVLYSSLHYPGDYGLIPRTYYEDGDPLDVLVMINEPTFPGCIIEARPIGIFHMTDRDMPDDKILAVPNTDPLAQDYHDVSDIPQHFLSEVAHFFQVYKDLEGVRVEPGGWADCNAARERIEHAIELYKKDFQPPSL
jgi:inorganic pyrophosphatase